MPTMFGPAFDDSGKIVEREVSDADVVAYKNAGYIVGSIPKAKQEKTPAESVAESDETSAKKAKKK